MALKPGQDIHGKEKILKDNSSCCGIMKSQAETTDQKGIL